MPEIAEVECARCLLERMCCSRRIAKVAVMQDTKVFDGTLDGSVPDDFLKRLKGARVEKASRKGKQLWLQLDTRPWILFHLGMTGSFAGMHPDGTVESAEYVNTKVDLSSWPPKHWKLHFEMEGGGKLAFIAVRRFERIRLVQDPASEPPVSLLGFDPLYELPPLDDFAARLRQRQGSVKGALLDQSFSAGVGNWVADEVCYQAKLHPEVPPAAMSASQVAALHTALGHVVSTACAASADSSQFPADWLFHHRWGKKEGKVGGNPVKFSTVASRTTAWVPAVQKKTYGCTPDESLDGTAPVTSKGKTKEKTGIGAKVAKRGTIETAAKLEKGGAKQVAKRGAKVEEVDAEGNTDAKARPSDRKRAKAEGSGEAKEENIPRRSTRRE